MIIFQNFEGEMKSIRLVGLSGIVRKIRGVMERAEVVIREVKGVKV